jgi:hypothetical protein
MGRSGIPEDDLLPTKSLSFVDFNDEKKSLLRKNKENEQNLDFDSDGDETSEWLSVDEGAIAVLSMDEIRNMRRLQ